MYTNALYTKTNKRAFNSIFRTGLLYISVCAKVDLISLLVLLLVVVVVLLLQLLLL